MAEKAQVINLSYKPRKWFKAFHARKQRFAVLVCHRRLGKTEAALNDMILQALAMGNEWRTYRPNNPPRFMYVAPQKTQAKDTIWLRLKGFCRDFIHLCQVREGEASITLPNGAVIKLYGGDDPETLRGGYVDGVIFDEYGDMKAEVYKIVRFSLSDFRGWAVFMGTPKGKNQFWDRLQYAIRQQNKADLEGKECNWFHMVLKQSETQQLTAEEVADIVEECEGDEDFVAQELECSFDAAIKGSYFGKHIALVEARNCIKPTLPYDPHEPVSCAMDVGRADYTAIWFWQCVAGNVNFFKYFEATGLVAQDVIDMLQLMPYTWETIWLPHDAKHHLHVSRFSIIEQYQNANMPVRKVKNPDEGNKIIHGLNRVRDVLKTYPIQFDLSQTYKGLECLRNYSHKWDVKKQAFTNEPEHDKWSHGADAFRYACLSITPNDLKRSVESFNARQLAKDKVNTQPASDLNSWTLDKAFEYADAQRARRTTIGRV